MPRREDHVRQTQETFFEAKASLGGAIDVYGNPKTFNQTISLGGNITEIKND